MDGKVFEVKVSGTLSGDITFTKEKLVTHSTGGLLLKKGICSL